MRNKLDGNWAATGEGTVPAKQLDWRFTGTGWLHTRQSNSNPDPALREWMVDMREWGDLVAKKCKDLEARVSELEEERDRLANRKGGAR